MAHSEQAQLILDDPLELGLRLRPAQKDPIDEEAGRAGHAGFAALL
jgi:hypothetical protein